jgi:glycosyltransferase involved in cell wall biosynthesis
MKILWINHRDPRHPQAGGAEVHLAEVGKRLVQKGCEVTLLSEKFPGSDRTETIDGIRVIRIGNKFTIHLKAPLLVSQLARYYDVVIDDVAHAVPWWSRIATTRPVIGIVHHVHQLVIPVELRLPIGAIVSIAEKTIKYAYKRMITDSESTKVQMQTLLGIEASRIEVVHLGVDHDVYRPSGEKFSDPTILWLGRIRQYKNVEHLIAAFGLAKKDVPNLKLVIYGNGDHQERVIEFTRKLRLKDVLFLNSLSRDQKVRLLQNSWALCLTSMVEGWGLVITEAAACATPAISYDTGASREAIVDGETGFLVNYGDIEAFARKIRLVASNSGLRASLSKAALQYSRRFDWDKTAHDTLRVFQQVTSP